MNTTIQSYVRENAVRLTTSLVRLYNAIKPSSENSYNTILMIGTRGLFYSVAPPTNAIVANMATYNTCEGQLADALLHWFSCVGDCRTRYGSNYVRTFVLPIWCTGCGVFHLFFSGAVASLDINGLWRHESLDAIDRKRHAGLIFSRAHYEALAGGHRKTRFWPLLTAFVSAGVLHADDEPICEIQPPVAAPREKRPREQVVVVAVEAAARDDDDFPISLAPAMSMEMLVSPTAWADAVHCVDCPGGVHSTDFREAVVERPPADAEVRSKRPRMSDERVAIVQAWRTMEETRATLATERAELEALRAQLQVRELNVRQLQEAVVAAEPEETGAVEAQHPATETGVINGDVDMVVETRVDMDEGEDSFAADVVPPTQIGPLHPTALAGEFAVVGANNDLHDDFASYGSYVDPAASPPQQDMDENGMPYLYWMSSPLILPTEEQWMDARMDSSDFARSCLYANDDQF